jgi:hypothetical protein
VGVKIFFAKFRLPYRAFFNNLDKRSPICFEFKQVRGGFKMGAKWGLSCLKDKPIRGRTARMQTSISKEQIMNSPVPRLLRAIAVGSAAFLAQNAFSQVVAYNNTTTYSDDVFNYANISPNPDSYTGEAGNQVILAGSLTSYTITEFTTQFDFVNGSGTTSGSPAGGETVDLRFYANTGPLVDGYASPAATPFFDSTPISLSSLPGFAGFTTGGTLNDTGLSVTVPKDFTWTVTFGGLTGTETAGLALYGPAPSVGQNFGDAWIQTSGGWTLETATGATPLEFGTALYATAVPEPNTIALGVMGACALFAARRKK